MVTPTNLTPEEFLREIKSWGATKDALIKVRMMRKGDTAYFRLQTPKGETLQTQFPYKYYEAFGFLELGPIAVPAVWEDETELIKSLSKKLEQSQNATNITPNRYQNIQY